MGNMGRLFLGVILALGLSLSARADVKMSAVFGDHMVLQQGKPVPVFGTADAGEKVTVTFGKQTASAEPDKDGKWMVKLEALKASANPQVLTVKGKNTLTFNDVLVGEVWVCSGQSNMEWTTSKTVNAAEEIAAAKFPGIRLLTVKKAVSDKPNATFEGQWAACSPETVPAFSAVGFYFGRELHKKLNVPVGLISSSWGGTRSQGWTRREALEVFPESKADMEKWEKDLAQPADFWKKKYDADMAKWKEADAKAKAEKKPGPRKPMQHNPADSPQRTANLYNGMIAPLIPFAIQGAIWYQGESNAGEPNVYAKVFPAMITDWRKQWGEGDFPFLFVQLANYLPRKTEPADTNWARLREAQTQTLSLPKTGMAVIIDIGEEKNIHPQNKQDVGKRLCMSAMNVAYGKKDSFPTSPLFEKMTVKDGKAVLTFKYVDGGLVSKPEGKIKGFAIAGADKKFVWADAVIGKNGVTVSSPEVKEPVAVRYGWEDNPEVTLYDKNGLPVSPFRTDDWPLEVVKPAAPAATPAPKAK